MKKVNWKKSEKKRRLDICPYCHGEMLFRFFKRENYIVYNSASIINGCFKCDECGAQSPMITVGPNLIDLKKAAEQIGYLVDNVFEEREEKEEYEDE